MNVIMIDLMHKWSPYNQLIYSLDVSKVILDSKEIKMQKTGLPLSKLVKDKRILLPFDN